MTERRNSRPDGTEPSRSGRAQPARTDASPVLARIDATARELTAVLRSTLARCGVSTIALDDALQELTVAAWRASRRFVSDRSPAIDAWLTVLARRVAITLARRDRASRRGYGVDVRSLESLDRGACASLDDDPARRHEIEDTAATLRAVIAELSEREREILAAVYSSVLTRSEIAQEFGVSMRRLRKLAAAARASVRRRLPAKLRAALAEELRETRRDETRRDETRRDETRRASAG